MAKKTPAPAVPIELKQLGDLRHFDCRFPIGDPKNDDFGFCGKNVLIPPYCNFHRAITYNLPRKRKDPENASE